MDTEQEEDDQLSIGEVSPPTLRDQARATAQPSHKAGGKVRLYTGVTFA